MKETTTTPEQIAELKADWMKKAGLVLNIPKGHRKERMARQTAADEAWSAWMKAAEEKSQ